jgi:hypothetical protein
MEFSPMLFVQLYVLLISTALFWVGPILIVAGLTRRGFSGLGAASKFWLVYWFVGTAGLFAWAIALGGSEWAGPFRSETPGLLLVISYFVSTWSR